MFLHVYWFGSQTANRNPAYSKATIKCELSVQQRILNNIKYNE